MVWFFPSCTPPTTLTFLVCRGFSAKCRSRCWSVSCGSGKFHRYSILLLAHSSSLKKTDTLSSMAATPKRTLRPSCALCSRSLVVMYSSTATAGIGSGATVPSRTSCFCRNRTVAAPWTECDYQNNLFGGCFLFKTGDARLRS